eukprot:TRINITY_DN40206_c0_g1_i1.p1 TRINITY_DN40206_c0_g1~~TRINITY_DN40206_c0_g1_i1.p1  ORF type:complete len:366 (-),score=49.96 TRINITY_DN40206_c0_g1_i1:84-1046(-)
MSTTGVIISNKALLGRQKFPFILTGLMLNFCTTFSVLEMSIRMGSFEAKSMPTRERWLLSMSAVLTILSNNASVEANSVGTYQIAKLLIVPCIIILEKTRGIERTYTTSMYVALAIITIGVALTTVTDVELTPRGCAIAACSTVLTAHYQIWQGSKGKEHGLTAQQITHTVQIPQIILALPAAICLDGMFPWAKQFLLLPTVGLMDQEAGQLRIFTGPGGPAELSVNMLMNNLFAVGINLTTYYLIAATSPVTYQIIGQAKTVLVIALGYVLFDTAPPPGWFALRVVGVATALTGVAWYGHLKRNLPTNEASPADGKKKA